MDKARRHELKMLKFKKRIKQLRIDQTKGKFYAYRSHGAPCSCSGCSPHREIPYKMKHSDKVKSMRLLPDNGKEDFIENDCPVFDKKWYEERDGSLVPFERYSV